MRQLNLDIPALPTNTPQLFVNVFDDHPTQIPATCTFFDRWTVQFDNGASTPPGNGLNLTFLASGFKPFTCRMAMPPDNAQAEGGVVIALEPSALPFPPSVNPYLGVITPFDANDPGGDVATVLPPEAVARFRPLTRDINVWRGDIAGVTTPRTPPFVTKNGDGANTTPPNMWLSFFLDAYDAEWRTYYLGEYYKRGYTHLAITAPCVPFDQFAGICGEIRAAGQFVAYWDFDIANITALAALNAFDILILGGELNRRMSPEDLLVLIDQAAAICGPKQIPIYLHFTSNVPTWQPNSSNPHDWLVSLVGKIRGICWQGDQNDPAGTMAAHFWDTRRIWGTANSGFNVVYFETLASNNLTQGDKGYDETNNRRRGYEGMCAGRDGLTFVPAPAGYGNGGSDADGGIL